MKRATNFVKFPIMRQRISIHALVKRATDTFIYLCQFGADFNPRPREEGDCTWSDNGLGLTYISIHALVKRATQRLFPCAWGDEFQSTPSWRGRRFTSGIKWKCKEYFNPRPREEGDTYGHRITLKVKVFQSTPSWRGRPFLYIYALSITSFQSTPSWRGRLYFDSIADLNSYFNPRPREEGDTATKTEIYRL